MANSSFPQKRNLYTLSTLSLLLLFLFCLFLFTKRALEPNLSLYRDLISLKRSPILLSPPRSTQFHDKIDDLRQITVPSENVDNEEKKVPISSKSDLEDNFNEITDEKITGPISPNEKLTGPISSKSNLEEKNRGKLKKSSEEAVLGETEGAFINAIVEKLRGCDIYQGKWVRDEDYPLYRPGSCPYVDGGFDCQSNGRPDSGYLNWRWKPDDCDLPRFWSF